MWASGETKAIEAAGLLAAAHGLPVLVDEGLCENDRNATGFLPPAAFEKMADAFFAGPRQSVRGWERARDAQAGWPTQSTAFWSADTKGDIGFVAHGGVGTLLLCQYLGEPICRGRDQPFQGHLLGDRYGNAGRPDTWRPIAPRWVPRRQPMAVPAAPGPTASRNAGPPQANFNFDDRWSSTSRSCSRRRAVSESRALPHVPGRFPDPDIAVDLPGGDLEQRDRGRPQQRKLMPASSIRNRRTSSRSGVGTTGWNPTPARRGRGKRGARAEGPAVQGRLAVSSAPKVCSRTGAWITPYSGAPSWNSPIDTAHWSPPRRN